MTIHNAKWVFLQSNELNALFNIMWISSPNGKNLMEYTIKPLNQCKSNNGTVYINLLKLRH